MTTRLIDLEKVHVPTSRLRDVSKAGVEYIANSFDTVGQLQPIIVSKALPFDNAPELDDDMLVLRAGAHRTAAAKHLNWHHIEAKELDLSGYSKEMAEIIVQIVEVDENLNRVDLDQAGRTRFTGARIKLTAKRNAVAKQEKAEARLAAANAVRAEKVAAKKAAKDKAAKAKAAAEFEAAERERKAADEQLRSARTSSLANEQGLARRLDEETLTAVSDELGIKRAVVSNLNSWHSALGDAYLKAVEGTRLGSQAELQAMVRLRKDFPKRADYVERMAVRSKETGEVHLMVPPSGELGKRTQEKQQMTAAEELKTPEGKRENFRKVCVALQSEIAKLVQALGILEHGERQNHPEVHRMQADIAALIERTRKRGEQKRTGTEHRYGGDKEGPTRAEAENELKAHAKEIERIVKAKNKKKSKKA